MAVSEIWITSEDGRLLAFKKYRNDIAFHCGEVFVNVLRDTEEGFIQPIMTVKGVQIFNIKRNKIYFIAASSNTTNSVQAIELLSRLYQVCKDMFGVVNEESIKKNFVLLHEILDEFLDYGYIQLASTEKIKPYIQSNPVIPRTIENLSSGLFGVEHRVPDHQASNKPVIKSRIDQEQRKNEIFVDIVERMAVLIDSKGCAQRCEIQGKISMKSFMMGCPQVKMGFSENLVIGQQEVKGYGRQTYVDDHKFHSCVNTDDLLKEKVLMVQPPEGEFALMTYKVSGDLAYGLPFKLHSYVTKNPSSRDLEVGLKLKCEIPTSNRAVNVKLQLPVPKSVSSVSQQLGGPEQSADFTQKTSTLMWTIKKLPGKGEESAHFKLIEGNMNPETSELELGPVSMDFEISGYLCSNLQIKYLKLQDKHSDFTPARFIRYITTPDSYVIKLH